MGSFVVWFELYGTRGELKSILEQELRGQTYFLRQDAFERNGMQVHRVYLTDLDHRTRLASKYFDASNWCQHCRSFNVAVHHQWMTTVFCKACGLNRKYRPDAPEGRDNSLSYESETYPLQHCREIAYEETLPKRPPTPQVVGRYDLWRHTRTGVVYRPTDNRAIWRAGKALFEHSDGIRTRIVWLRQSDLEFYAINQPIYA